VLAAGCWPPGAGRLHPRATYSANPRLAQESPPVEIGLRWKWGSARRRGNERGALGGPGGNGAAVEMRARKGDRPRGNIGPERILY